MWRHFTLSIYARVKIWFTLQRFLTLICSVWPTLLVIMHTVCKTGTRKSFGLNFKANQPFQTYSVLCQIQKRTSGYYWTAGCSTGWMPFLSPNQQRQALNRTQIWLWPGINPVALLHVLIHQLLGEWPPHHLHQLRRQYWINLLISQDIHNTLSSWSTKQLQRFPQEPRPRYVGKWCHLRFICSELASHDITRMLAINVSISNLTVARLEQFPSPQMNDNKPSFTRKPHVVIFRQSPFAANAVPKLVAMAMYLRPLSSPMSSMDSLSPKTHP